MDRSETEAQSIVLYKFLPLIGFFKCQIRHSRSLWWIGWWSAYLICFLMPLECLKPSERSGR